MALRIVSASANSQVALRWRPCAQPMRQLEKVKYYLINFILLPIRYFDAF
jgi:hypothetical protein